MSAVERIARKAAAAGLKALADEVVKVPKKKRKKKEEERPR